MSREQSRAAAVLQQEYISCPVTALAFYQAGNGNLFLLVGEDGWLKVFDAVNSRLMGQLRIFDRQPIHGINVRHSNGKLSEEEPGVLLWGAHLVAVLAVASLESLLGGRQAQNAKQFHAPDWIYDACLSPHDVFSGALVTAHNEIIPLYFLQGGLDIKFGRTVSPSRPMLYSTNLCWLTQDCILVAAGTVFGEIVMWKCHLHPSIPPSAACEVMFVFTGHEGSIFGVSISPELEVVPGHKTRLVASCSDDRTIRVWDIAEKNSTGTSKEAGLVQLEEARETGFLQNSEADRSHRDDSLRCVAMAMGHISRIWHVSFAGIQKPGASSKPAPLVLYSSGEDATTQRWEMDLDLAQWQAAPWRNLGINQNELWRPDSTIGRLRHTETFISHSGKNLWSSTSFLDDSGVLFTATGGADGRVTVIKDPQRLTRDNLSREEIDEVRNSAPQRSKITTMTYAKILKLVDGPTGNTASGKGGFKCYLFLSLTDLVAVTYSGRLFLHDSESSEPWREYDVGHVLREELSTGIVMKRPREGMMVVGCESGRVYLFQKHEGFRQITELPGKVTNIICLKSETESGPGTGTISLFVTILRHEHAVLLDFTLSEDIVCTMRYVNLRRHVAVTGAGFCGRNLVIGSRLGDIIVCAESHENASSWLVVGSRRDSRSKDAVTSIVPLPGNSSSFLAGSRDGRCRIYSIKNGAEAEIIVSLEHDTASPLSMIEDAWFTPTLGTGGMVRSSSYDLIFSGFRGKNFVVWNETSRQEHLRVDCGGGQRALAVITDPNIPDRLHFVFSDGAKTHLHAQDHVPTRIMKSGGGHGREVRAISATWDRKLVATGSEDTTVRIWEHITDGREDLSGCKGGDEFRCLAVLDKHAAGIQSLKWLGNEYLLSSAGNEEFFIWRVKRLDSHYTGLAVICEAVYPDRTADGDLRVMDFDAKWVQDTDESKGMLISLVLSNSTLKTYRYAQDEGFTRLSEARYSGACLTQIRHLRTEAGLISVLTASTDGHIVIWEARRQGFGEYCLQTAARLHQNTIKSLEVIREPGSNAKSSWCIITGGDDNALGFLRLELEAEDQKFVVCEKARVKSAHAAAITAMCLLEDRGGNNRVVTVSNDQQLKVWEIRNDSRDLPFGIALLDEQYSAVADPGAVEVIQKGKVVVAGVGMEVWAVS